MDTNIKCGVEVRCYDYCTRPCLRQKGHTGGHNPFSDNAYDVLEVTPELIVIEKQVTGPVTFTKNDLHCLWSDVYGMCIYQLGHKGPHESLGYIGEQ
jgi:hypothetical protein